MIDQTFFAFAPCGASISTQYFFLFKDFFLNVDNCLKVLLNLLQFCFHFMFFLAARCEGQGSLACYSP